MVGVKGTGTLTITPTGAVTTDTDATLDFPNGVSGKPVAIRVASSVSAVVKLPYTSSDEVQVIANPNAPPSGAKIPAKAFGTGVSSVPIKYQCSAAGSIYISVDYA